MFSTDLEKAIQFSSVAQSCLTLCDPMNCSTPGLPVHHQIPEFIQTHVHWVGDAIQASHPLSSPSPPAPNPPSTRVFSNESTLHMRWPKYWSVSISPSSEYSGLISFRIDWFDLLALQVILKSLLQHHSSKASILECSAFFMVQLSHPYMTTGKMIALTRWTFVGKVMSVFFKVFHSFLSKEQVSFNFMAAVTICTDFGAQENKVVTVSTVSPIYLPWSNDTGCHDLHFWMLNFKSAFSLSSFILIKSLFSSSSLSAIRVVSSAYPK